MEPIKLSETFSPWLPGGFGLALFALAIFVLMGIMLVMTSWLGEKRSGTTSKQLPYESGIIPSGNARLRYPVPFFMVAIFFLLFDVEGAFIFSWAVSCKSLGWMGWCQMAFFIFVLLLGLIYIWIKGGLDWYPKNHQL
jgi:NADH-quinone oxidoreductase subunit A